MKFKNLIVLAVIGLLILTACSSGKSSKAKLTQAFHPDWYDLQDNPEYVYTYGQAEKVSQNASEQAAYANAMQEAANYVEAHVQSLIKNYTEEAGVKDPQVLALTSSVARVISNAKFSGTQISKRESYIKEDGRYQTFIRVSIPKDEINRNLRNQIRNEEALYNQFKASQAFQELDHLLEQQQ
ncbi:MAG: LPP20 family lipoprotein [Candidatus Cloacimonetes bacterium]|nr:LPP20 family lipoprotein [Candidatus Cloacimonadota bacterium]